METAELLESDKLESKLGSDTILSWLRCSLFSGDNSRSYEASMS